MRKFIIIFLLLLFGGSSFANDKLIAEQTVQNRIDNIGSKILNANKIENRIVFVYNKDAKKSALKVEKTLTKRQVVMYDEYYKFIQDDNELAAYLAREISIAARTFRGFANGWLTSVQIKAAPKKYEMVADKAAVDLMVKANYNPVAIITFINKAYPQTHQDFISTHNLTSKRLANIYEYIYTKYPYYLENNEYIQNESYQNFLLTSVNNRKLLEDKVRNKSKENLKYE